MDDNNKSELPSESPRVPPKVIKIEFCCTCGQINPRTFIGQSHGVGNEKCYGPILDFTYKLDTSRLT